MSSPGLKDSAARNLMHSNTSVMDRTCQNQCMGACAYLLEGPASRANRFDAFRMSILSSISAGQHSVANSHRSSQQLGAFRRSISSLEGRSPVVMLLTIANRL